MKDAFKESGFNLIDCITGIELRFKKHSLYDRTQDYLSGTKSNETVDIIPYHTDYKQAYYDLNVSWMETTIWNFEDKDIEALSNPEHHILDKGGEIFFAIKGGKAFGTVTMKQAGPGRFELAKLIVDKNTRGYGMGVGLCQFLVDRFNARGGKTLFLETNSALEHAIALYKRVGFIELPVPHRSYDRTDYYMEWRKPSRKAA